MNAPELNLVIEGLTDAQLLREESPGELARGQEIITEIADRMPTESLRRNFVERAQSRVAQLSAAV